MLCLNMAKSSGTQLILGVHPQSHLQWITSSIRDLFVREPKVSALHTEANPQQVRGTLQPQPCWLDMDPHLWLHLWDRLVVSSHGCGFCWWPGSWRNEPSILFLFPCCRQLAFPPAASMRLQQLKEACKFS